MRDLDWCEAAVQRKDEKRTGEKVEFGYLQTLKVYLTFPRSIRQPRLIQATKGVNLEG